MKPPPKSKRSQKPMAPLREVFLAQNQKRVPRLLHERDESADSQGGPVSAQGLQAYKDAISRQQDTGTGPPTDRAYKKLKA